MGQINKSEELIHLLGARKSQPIDPLLTDTSETVDSVEEYGLSKMFLEGSYHEED